MMLTFVSMETAMYLQAIRKTIRFVVRFSILIQFTLYLLWINSTTILVDWVRKQRTEYKKATNDAHSAMSKDRIDLLNNLGFEWENPRKRKVIAQSERRTEANYFDDRWEEMFKRLKRFQRKYGNTLVPTKYDNDRQLGNWVCSQRTNRKQWIKGGYTSPKNIDRFSRLDEIGFVWNIPDYQATEEGAIAVATSKRSTSRKRYNNIEDEIEWFNQFEKLKNFKEKHGHCLVPRNCEDDQQLFKWVYEQQELYKKQALSIKEGTKTIKSQSQRRTQKRITFLNSIDFEWEVNESMDNSKWLSMYNKVKNFRLDQNQKGPPIFPDSPAYTEVSKWVEHQKSELMKFKDSRNSKLTEKKVSLLERIGVK